MGLSDCSPFADLSEYKALLYIGVQHSYAPSQQTQNICITFIQRRPNVFDVGPTLTNVMQMFCFYWDYHII